MRIRDRVRLRLRDRVGTSVTVYSLVYNIYGKFHIYGPSRHCYGDFSGTLWNVSISPNKMKHKNIPDLVARENNQHSHTL